MSRSTIYNVVKTLTAAYNASMEAGDDMVSLHVDWLADALEFLNDPLTPLHPPFLDDRPQTDIVAFVDMKIHTSGRKDIWHDLL